MLSDKPDLEIANPNPFSFDMISEALADVDMPADGDGDSSTMTDTTPAPLGDLEDMAMVDDSEIIEGEAGESRRSLTSSSYPSRHYDSSDYYPS